MQNQAARAKTKAAVMACSCMQVRRTCCRVAGRPIHAHLTLLAQIDGGTLHALPFFSAHLRNCNLGRL